jgi:hypothetical protein
MSGYHIQRRSDVLCGERLPENSHDRKPPAIKALAQQAQRTLMNFAYKYRWCRYGQPEALSGLQYETGRIKNMHFAEDGVRKKECLLAYGYAAHHGPSQVSSSSTGT